MAMIKCPECGKDVSSFAPACPNCGFPIQNDSANTAQEENTVQIDERIESENNATEAEEGAASTENESVGAHTTIVEAPTPVAYSSFTEKSNVNNKKPNKKALIALCAVLVCVIAVIASVVGNNSKKVTAYNNAERYLRQGEYELAISAYQELGNYKDAAECASYCEALSFCEIGDYESAYNMLMTIPDYEKTQKLLYEIYYETRLFEGLNDLKVYLKNPDSLSVKSVSFHYDEDAAETGEGATMEEPACIISESAQNGFGGFSSAYALLTYRDDSEQYEYFGSCDSLDPDDYDLTDSDDLYEWLTCVAINAHFENPEIENAVDIDRVQSIISSGKYSSIKRISGLTFDLISDLVITGKTETTDSADVEDT